MENLIELQDKLTPYIEEHDLLRLLDDLELRLSELAVLIRDGKLYVGNIKNNINTKVKKEDGFCYGSFCEKKPRE